MNNCRLIRVIRLKLRLLLNKTWTRAQSHKITQMRAKMENTNIFKIIFRVLYDVRVVIHWINSSRAYLNLSLWNCSLILTRKLLSMSVDWEIGESLRSNVLILFYVKPSVMRRNDIFKVRFFFLLTVNTVFKTNHWIWYQRKWEVVIRWFIYMYILFFWTSDQSVIPFVGGA